MTTRLILLLAAALLCWAVPAAGQTIKSLGYNTTNGRIVAATNLVWTNAFSFSTNTVAAQVRTNLGGTTVGNSVFTATNAAAAATAIGLGTTDTVSFSKLNAEMDAGSGQSIVFNSPIAFDDVASEDIIEKTRTNFGLGLPALTNTSNVTTMRALAGSTNTNEPYSGTVALTNTNVLTFSNGVLLKIQ